MIINDYVRISLSYKLKEIIPFYSILLLPHRSPTPTLLKKENY